MSAKAGKKRASPGADVEKNLLQGAELSEGDAKKLEAIQRDQARAELVIERRGQVDLLPVYEKRRPILKSIPKFWPVALMNHSLIAYHVQHNADQLAFSYLEDVWVTRDAGEPKCFTIELSFGENPFFTNTVLRKEFKFVPPPELADAQPGPDGISEANLQFSWDRDVCPTAMKIDWKDPSKALTKLHPREEGDDIPSDAGSFFNFFESESDPFDIGLNIANETFPEAIDYFLGNAKDDELDTEDEEDSDDDDDADEIDLEKPKTKKQKNA